VKSPAERRFYRNQVNLHNAKARAKARAAQAVSEDLLPAKAVSNVTDATQDKEMMRKGAEVTTDAEEPSTVTLEIESSGSVQGKEKGIVNEDPETLVLQPATVPAPGVAAPVVAPAAPVAAAANPITAAQPAATAAAAAAQPATAAPAVDTAAAAASQAAPAAVPAAAAKPVAVAAVPGDVAQPATPAAAAAAPAAAGSTVTEKNATTSGLPKDLLLASIVGLVVAGIIALIMYWRRAKRLEQVARLTGVPMSQPQRVHRSLFSRPTNHSTLDAAIPTDSDGSDTMLGIRTTGSIKGGYAERRADDRAMSSQASIKNPTMGGVLAATRLAKGRTSSKSPARAAQARLAKRPDQAERAMTASMTAQSTVSAHENSESDHDSVQVFAAARSYRERRSHR
jgi:hypothetical protein